MSESSLTIHGTLDQIPMARAFIAECARQAGLEDHAVHHCELAVDEVCTNIIEHGYGGGEDRLSVELVCENTPSSLFITIFDEGTEFNPLAREEPDPTMPLEQRGHGGWGIYFMKRFMDDFQYERVGSRNRLTLIKYIVDQEHGADSGN